LTSLDQLCRVASTRYTERAEPPISFEEYTILRDKFVGKPSEPLPIAARMLPATISPEEFQQALSEIRKQH
jgi:hypothetical protein